MIKLPFENRIYTVSEVAEALGKSEITIHRALADQSSRFIQTAKPFRLSEKGEWNFYGNNLNVAIGSESYTPQPQENQKPSFGAETPT